jgi:hypothetical protein
MHLNKSLSVCVSACVYHCSAHLHFVPVTNSDSQIDAHANVVRNVVLAVTNELNNVQDRFLQTQKTLYRISRMASVQSRTDLP